MGKIGTKELLDNFFESEDGKKYQRYRDTLKEPQLYAYELEIGKELVDMSVDELIDFLANIRTRRNKNDSNVRTSNSSIDQMLAILRRVFDYYIDNYEVIKNPLYDKRLRGTELLKNISQNQERLTFEIVEGIIRNLHRDLPTERADYIELIMLLFYCGFENAEQIIYMQEKDVNHRNQTVSMSGKTIHLSDRCYTLLRQFDEMEMLDGWRSYVIVSWRGSYFKFIVQARNAETIDERTEKQMRETISVMLCKYVNNAYDTKINYSNLYTLGFYDYCVKKYGEEKLVEMLDSSNNVEYNDMLRQTAREYGYKCDNISLMKRKLKMFTEQM